MRERGCSEEELGRSKGREEERGIERKGGGGRDRVGEGGRRTEREG